MSSELEAIRAMLRRAQIARLATVTPAGRATVAPFWFAFHDDQLFIVTEESATLANLRRNPQATLLVDFGASYADLHGAMIQGVAEIYDADTAPSWVRDGITAYARKYAPLEDERVSVRSFLTGKPGRPHYIVLTPRRARWFSVGGYLQGALEWASGSDSPASGQRTGGRGGRRPVSP